MEVKITTAIRPAQTAPAVSKAALAKKADTTAGTQRVDTYESSSGARAFGDSMMDGSADTGKGLVLNQLRPAAGTLDIQELRPDPDSQAAKMDWADVEKTFQNISLSSDRPYNVDATVRHTAALYVAAKHCLTEQYSGEDQKEILESRLKQLDCLYENAKNRVADSYQTSVGSFYDKYTGKGTSTAMKNSLMAAFDQKVAEAETSGSGLLDPEKGYSFDYICTGLQANMIYNEENKTAADTPAAGNKTDENEPGTYSLEDLKAAAVVAEASAQADSGQKLHLLSDEELGIMMALSHMKLAVMLAGTGADQDTVNTFLNAFRSRQCQNMNESMYGAYQYTIGQYQKTGSMETAITSSMKHYASSRSFSHSVYDSGQTDSSQVSRYQFDIRQFMDILKKGDTPELVRSIAKGGPGGLIVHA